MTTHKRTAGAVYGVVRSEIERAEPDLGQGSGSDKRCKAARPSLKARGTSIEIIRRKN